MWGINKDSKNDMKAPLGTIEANRYGMLYRGEHIQQEETPPHVLTLSEYSLKLQMLKMEHKIELLGAKTTEETADVLRRHAMNTGGQILNLGYMPTSEDVLFNRLARTNVGDNKGSKYNHWVEVLEEARIPRIEIPFYTKEEAERLSAKLNAYMYLAEVIEAYVDYLEEKETSPEEEKVYYIYTYLEDKDVYVYLLDDGHIGVSSEFSSVNEIGETFHDYDKALKYYNNMSKSDRQLLRVHREWVNND